MIYDISAETLGSPVYPGDPPPQLKTVSAIKNGDGCNLTALSMSSHAGTHVDAPAHFLERGDTIGQLDLALFIGECHVVSASPSLLTGADIDKILELRPQRLLIKGEGRTHLTRSAAFALASGGVQLVGIDAQSIAATDGEQAEVHRELLAADVPILEGLRLRDVQPGVYFLFAPPVNIGAAEGAPCRAVLLSDD